MTPSTVGTKPPLRWTHALCVLATVSAILRIIPGDLLVDNSTKVVEWLVGVGIDTIAGLGLLFAIRGRRLLPATFIFLAAPTFLFAIGWLRPLVAGVTVAALAISLVLALRSMKQQVEVADAPSRGSLVACALVLAWIHLSGIGGGGHQSSDWQLHNGRLLDLIELPWPVRYGKDQNLVLYLAWFMPAAVVGKIAGVASAMMTLRIETFAGLWMALLWLARLAERKPSGWLVGAFALFGGFDLIGYWWSAHRFMPGGDWPLLPVEADVLCFWSAPQFGFFVGNWLPANCQLCWSPHQVVAGWLVAALVAHLARIGRPQSVVLAVSLLFFWSPLIALALAPLTLVLLAACLRRNWREVVTPQNVIGPAVLLGLFGAYYFGGSAATNPAAFAPARAAPGNLVTWIVFELLGWGAWWLAGTRAATRGTPRDRLAWFALGGNLLLLPLVWYGEYADLMCRGSAALMFLLLAHLFRAAPQMSRSLRATLVGAGILFASASALAQFIEQARGYGERATPVRAPDYAWSAESLGPDSSFFARHLARPTAATPTRAR